MHDQRLTKLPVVVEHKPHDGGREECPTANTVGGRNVVAHAEARAGALPRDRGLSRRRNDARCTGVDRFVVSTRVKRAGTPLQDHVERIVCLRCVRGVPNTEGERVEGGGRDVTSEHQLLKVCQSVDASCTSSSHDEREEVVLLVVITTAMARS